MIIAKANAKEHLGEFICLSIAKANAKTNLQIFLSGAREPPQFWKKRSENLG